MASSKPASGRFDVPREGFSPAATLLRHASPEQAGLDPGPIRGAEERLTAWTRSDAADGHPRFAGAVGLLAHDGMVVDLYATGSRVRYADAYGTELPADQREPMQPDTIFDLASVTKLFTAIAVLRLVERGDVGLTVPVARYLPAFGGHGKQTITVRQLLTHTSGLAPFLPLWRDWPDAAARIMAVLEVAPDIEPGSAYRYSDLNLIVLGVLVQRLCGATLDTVVARWITEPLGMTDTGFNPPKTSVGRIAATEYQTDPPRGLVHGQVHDENAWSLGGVAGHAGVFSTARDLAVLGQTLLNGGAYAGARILRPDTVRVMLTDRDRGSHGDDHGLGFELNQTWYMGGLSSPVSAGHTGFTGTSLVIDPMSGSIAILLTNRVHPSRSWGSINPARQTWATGLARALAVHPVRGPWAWYSGSGDGTATLTTPPIVTRSGSTSLRFEAFVDSAPSDRLVVEASRDGGHTWEPLRMHAGGRNAPGNTLDALSGAGHRSWWSIRADVPSAESVTLRWRFTTERSDTARGVYVDGILVTDHAGTLLDGQEHPDRLNADGFQMRSR